MFYVARFDEMDEGTAIFKCSNKLPVGPQLCDYEGMPTEYLDADLANQRKNYWLAANSFDEFIRSITVEE